MLRGLPPHDAPIRLLPLARRALERTVRPDADLIAIIEAFQQVREHRTIYVTEASGRLLGMITHHDLQTVINARYGVRSPGVVGFARQMRDLHRETAQHVMHDAPLVTSETPIRDALQLLRAGNLDALPIVDEDGRLVGELAPADRLELALDIAMMTSTRVPQVPER